MRRLTLVLTLVVALSFAFVVSTVRAGVAVHHDGVHLTFNCPFGWCEIVWPHKPHEPDN